MIKINNRYVVIGTALMWVALALGMIASKQQVIRTGQKILLETVPVDPRDLLRGDYVVLNYGISDLDLGKIPVDRQQYQRGEWLYVVLRPEGSFHVASRVASRKDQVLAPGEILIRGKVVFYYQQRMSLVYGIESFFVPEGAGKPIEEKMRRRWDSPTDKTPVTVEVVVGPDGTAMLSKMFIDQKEIKF